MRKIYLSCDLDSCSQSLHAFRPPSNPDLPTLTLSSAFPVSVSFALRLAVCSLCPSVFIMFNLSNWVLMTAVPRMRRRLSCLLLDLKDITLRVWLKVNE